MERHYYDPNQPQGTMSLMNLRSALRALFQGDLMPLRPRASLILDDMEYSSDANAQAEWSGTGVTVTKSTTKQEGNYAIQCVIDATDDRAVHKDVVLDLSAFKTVKLWEQVNVASSAIQFYVSDGVNESYWNITTNGTPSTWQEDTLDLTTPDDDNGTPADLSAITSYGFRLLDASKTYIFDAIKVICGANVAVESAIVGGFYQQVYLGLNRITFAGGSSPEVTPPSVNPRIDLLALNQDNELEWTAGEENSTPVEPTFPTDKIPICLIYCKTTMAKIVDYEDRAANPDEAYIYKDVRPLISISQITVS
ncbi:MAG: hypothetical protein WC569_02260 [Candidatus Omnitrophota bacterium]